MIHTLRIITLSVLLCLTFVDVAATFECDTVAIKSGQVSHRFIVEVARNAQERAKGLMFRKDLAIEEGMLFDFGETDHVAMWMKNTLIPLDMLFIREDGTIANIIHMAEPKTLTPRKSSEPVRAVLELKGGTARLLGIQPGHTVQHSLFGN